MIRTLRYYLKLYWLSVVRAYMTDMAYRLNFFASLLNTVVFFFVSLLFFNIVYFKAQAIGDWGRYEFFLLFGIFLLVNGIFESTIRKGLDRLPRYVRRGTFDGILLKPYNKIFAVSFGRLDFDDLASLLLAVLTSAYALSFLHLTWDLPRLLGFLISLVSSVVILYSNYLVIMSTTFWLVRVEQQEIYKNFLQMTKVPVDIYPKEVERFFTFIVPLAFFVMFPTKQLLGNLSPTLLLVTPIFAALNFLVAIKFWNFALKHYSSASS